MATTSTDLLQDAALAADLVREAGLLARAMREEGVHVAQKTSISDLVTAADRAAEDLVVRRLREARPADGIVGEERTEHGGTSGRRWVIDPVDGTYNFFHGLSWWCCALALADGDASRLGAVFHPHDEVLWVGGPELPTSRNGVPLEPLEDRPIDQVCGATYLHPPYFAEAGADRAFARVASRVATLRMLGSGSMDLAAVADGRIGLWFQHSVPDWDWLPGSALVEGAGGRTERVEVDGLRWSVAGRPAAVGQAVAALIGG